MGYCSGEEEQTLRLIDQSFMQFFFMIHSGAIGIIQVDSIEFAAVFALRTIGAAFCKMPQGE